MDTMLIFSHLFEEQREFMHENCTLLVNRAKEFVYVQSLAVNEPVSLT